MNILRAMGLLTTVASMYYLSLSKQRYDHADIAGTYPFSVSMFVQWQPSTITSISIVNMEYLLLNLTKSRLWNGFSSQVYPMDFHETKNGFHLYCAICTFQEE